MSTPRQQVFWLLLFFLLPFLIAGAFYLSPWLGWPALLVLGIYWIGITLMLTSEAKP